MAKRQRSSEDFSHSITDLMTSIAVVFVLLFLFFAQQQREQTEEKISETKRFVDSLLARLHREFGPLGIEVAPREGDPLTIEVTLPEEFQGSLTFELNDAHLLPEGERLVAEIIPRLLHIVCEDEFVGRIDSIVVEGHASTEGTERRNVELSAQRATEVLLFALHLGDVVERRSCFEGLAAASGRGHWHPKMKPRTDGSGEDEDRRASRRVVFRLRVKSFEQREALPTGELTVRAQVGVSP